MVFQDIPWTQLLSDDPKTIRDLLKDVAERVSSPVQRLPTSEPAHRLAKAKIEEGHNTVSIHFHCGVAAVIAEYPISITMVFPYESRVLMGGDETTKTIGVFSCPACEYESQLAKPAQREDSSRCSECEALLSHDHDQVSKEVDARKCRKCNETVALTHDNESGYIDGHLCFSCNSALTVNIDGHYRDPSNALVLDRIVPDETIPLTDETSVAYVSSTREQQAVKALHKEGEKYESAFMGYRPEETDAMLCFVGTTAAGYLTWTQ